MTRRILSDFLSSRSENFFQKDQKDPKNGEYSIFKWYCNPVNIPAIKFASELRTEKINSHNPISNPIIIEIYNFWYIKENVVD